MFRYNSIDIITKAQSFATKFGQFFYILCINKIITRQLSRRLK